MVIKSVRSSDGSESPTPFEPFKWDSEKGEWRYINVYIITRHYGGSEEGGWWYNWSEHIDGSLVNEKNLEEISKYLYDKHSGRAWGNISSMKGGEFVDIRLEDSLAESESKERPHYE